VTTDVAETVPALTPLLRERRSIRTYDDTHTLGDAELRLLLEAAQWAASAGNSQPWSFVVARRGDAAHRRFVELLSRGNASWAPRASALLVTLHQVASGPEDDAPGYSDYALYDLGQAVAQLGVQAAALGLAVHQFAGFDHEGVATAFGVPRHWRVTTGVAVGRALPDGADAEALLRERDRRPRTRKPLSELAFGARFGEPLELA
jgi:nitroreductase